MTLHERAAQTSLALVGVDHPQRVPLIETQLEEAVKEEHERTAQIYTDIAGLVALNQACRSC